MVRRELLDAAVVEEGDRAALVKDADFPGAGRALNIRPMSVPLKTKRHIVLAYASRSFGAAAMASSYEPPSANWVVRTLFVE